MRRETSVEHIMDANTKLFESLINMIPSMLVVYNPSTDKVLYVNDAINDILSFTSVELIATENAINTFVHKDDRSSLLSLIATVLKEQTQGSIVINVFDKDKKIVTLGCDLKFSHYTIQGKPEPVVMIVARDISAIVRIETSQLVLAEKNYESEQMTASIFDRMFDTYYRADEHGYIMKISKSIEHLLGYSVNEMLGRRSIDFFENKVEGIRAISLLRESDEPLIQEAYLIHKEGFHVWSSSSNKVWYKADGSFGGIEGVIRDMSAHKALLEALRVNYNKFQTIFNNSPIAIIHINKNSEISDCNLETCRVLDVSKEKLLGLNLLKELKNMRLRDAVVDVFATGSGHFVGDYTTLLSDKALYLDIYFKGLKNDKGEITSAMAILQDKSDEHRMSQELALEYEKSQRYLNLMPLIVVALDKDANIERINTRGTELICECEEDLVGKPWFEYAIKEEDREDVMSIFHELMQGKNDIVEYHENYISTPHGERLIAWHNTVLHDKNGNISGTLSAGEDITLKHEKEERIRLLAAMFENVSEGVIISDNRNNIIDVNPAFERITQYTKEEVVGKNPSFLTARRQDEHFYSNMWQEIKENGSWQGELYNRRKDGSVFAEWLSISAIVDDTTDVVSHHIALFADITHIKRSEKRLRHLALHDALTDMPNRLLLTERIEHAINRYKEGGRQFALLFIDLDDFKFINDTYGHAIGDLILKESVIRLRGSLRQEDTLARFGGDEFVVLIETLDDLSYAGVIAQKLLRCFEAPFLIESTQHFMHASIGISTYPDDAKSAEMLISCADASMYEAKQAGKNCYVFYTKEISEALEERMLLESQLRKAIDQGEFEMYYQPQIFLSDAHVVGVESLIRWHHSELGFVSPDRFIPIAEQTQLIIPLSQWIFTTVCIEAKKWVNAGVFKGHVALNVSGVHMEFGDVVTDIRHALDVSGLDAKYVEIEVTESVLMSNTQKWNKVINDLRAMDIYIAIDDFGTGFSSLTYLHSFDLHLLKIDKSFVDGLPNDYKSAAIANSIISLAKSLKLDVLAEGVEREDQASWLKNWGCDSIQGYLYAKPMEAKAIMDFLTQKSRDEILKF